MATPKYKINSPNDLKNYKSSETVRIGNTIYLKDGVKPRGGVTDTTKKKSTTNTTTTTTYKNLPADFDRSGLSPDQLQLADTIYGTINTNPNIDTSKLTDAEITGFVQDAQNALDPFFKAQQENLKAKYAQENKEVGQALQNSLETLGITDTRLRQDITQNLVRLQQDKDVASGKIDRAFVDDIRNRQDQLEQQGLSFSGEAIRQIGDKSAYQTNIQGEAQIDTAEKRSALETSYSRAVQDQNTELSRRASATNLGSLDFNNLTSDQFRAAIGNSNSDIDRSILQALQAKENASTRLGAAQGQEQAALSGQRSFDFRSLIGDEINQRLASGRTLPDNYQSFIRVPNLP